MGEKKKTVLPSLQTKIFWGKSSCYENPRLSLDHMSSSIVLTVGSGLVAGMLQSV